MASRAKIRRVSSSGKFLLDAGYVRGHANEAIHNFLAPLSGILLAATGKSDSESRRPPKSR